MSKLRFILKKKEVTRDERICAQDSKMNIRIVFFLYNSTGIGILKKTTTTKQRKCKKSLFFQKLRQE